MTNQSVNISKVNWKKVNDSLAKSGLKNSELNLLNTLYSNIIESHTNLNEMIFVRQYFFSVLLRVHNYLKEFNMLHNTENIKDIYDYIISSLLLSIEMSNNIAYDSGIIYFITRVMNKLFDLTNTSSALILPEPRYSLRQKYLIEPIIANNADKISMDKMKEYIDFIINMFSYNDSAHKCVSISVICSSLWIKNFTKMPYFVDDMIMPNFSNLPENMPCVADILVSRRNYMINAFSGEGFDMKNYSFRDYIEHEPDSLYEETIKYRDSLIKKREEEDFEYEELDDEDNEILSNREVFEDVLEEANDSPRLQPEAENEIKVVDALLTELDIAINGAMPRSNVKDVAVRGEWAHRPYPRMHRLFKESMYKTHVQDIIQAMSKFEDHLLRRPVTDEISQTEKIKLINDVIEIVKNENKREAEAKAAKAAKAVNVNSNDDWFSKIDLGEAAREHAAWLDFISYLQDILDVLAKSNDTLDIERINKILDGYNKHNSSQPKIMMGNFRLYPDGKITMDHLYDKDAIDNCTIEKGKVTSIPIVNEEDISTGSHIIKPRSRKKKGQKK